MSSIRENECSEPNKYIRKPIPRWLVVVLTAVISVVITLTAIGLLLGRHGIAVMEGWLLARWAFVEEDVDLQAVSNGALDGLVSALGDRWSYYVDDESYEALMKNRSNQYVGIGITVDYNDERGIHILAVTKNSPAERAGLVEGEIITAVEGVSAVGEARYDTVKLIAGKLGEYRTLTVMDANGVEREVTMLLERIWEEIVTGKLLDNGVGVVSLSNFNNAAAEKFSEMVDTLLEQGAHAFVFDMRGNGGGYVDELTEILDYLLPEGAVFQDQPRWGLAYIAESDANAIDLPFAVLIDQHSYSAAELFAAQLRESVDAYVVGEVTSGKGYSQITIPLRNGGAIGLSTAAYFTGNGVSLIGTGVVPDVEISLSEQQEALRAAGKLNPEDDPQLQAALGLLLE